MGSCVDPYDRFFEEPNPLCVRFHCLYPLWVGKIANHMETEVLRFCRQFEDIETAISGCLNDPASEAHECNSPRGVRFVYVCVKWTRASLQVLYA